LITTVRILLGTTALGPSESPSVDLVVVDDFLYGEPRVVPVPAALPLFGTGLGALGLIGWWRKRKAQAAA
jgi:hypothetical protein